MLENVKINPPCVSFKTFFNFITMMESRIPTRVDRSFWSIYLNGSNGKAVTNALLFLGLIDAHLAPTSKLVDFLNADAYKRMSLMSSYIKDSYGKAFDGKLHLENSTADQVKTLFKNTFGLSKEETDKCILFLTKACQYANINISSFMVERTKKKSYSNNKIVQKTDKNDKKMSKNNDIIVQNSAMIDQTLENKLPEFDSNWPDEIKLTWMKTYQVLIQSKLCNTNLNEK